MLPELFTPHTLGGAALAVGSGDNASKISMNLKIFSSILSLSNFFVTDKICYALVLKTIANYFLLSVCPALIGDRLTS